MTLRMCSSGGVTSKTLHQELQKNTTTLTITTFLLGCYSPHLPAKLDFTPRQSKPLKFIPATFKILSLMLFMLRDCDSMEGETVKYKGGSPKRVSIRHQVEREWRAAKKYN